MSFLAYLTLPVYGLILFVVYQYYRFFMKPKSQLAHYEKQGLPVIFAPFWGFLQGLTESVQKHKDIFYAWKQLNYMNPKPRAFASNLGATPVVALKDPELIKAFYMTQEKSYIKAPAACDVAKMILRNGTLLVDGNQWKAHRKLSNPLYSFDHVKERIPEIVAVTNKMLDKLKEKDLKKVNFMREMQHILLEITGKLFFDLELSSLSFKGDTVSGFVADLIDRSAVEALTPFTIFFSTDIVKTGIHPRHKALVKDINDLRGFLYGAAKAKLGEILAAKANGTATGKLPLLLEILYQQHQKLTEEHLDEVDLVDEFAMFTLGSMDTTSHAITFASYFHLNCPESQKKLPQEVNEIFKDLSQVSMDSLNKMDYMTAVLKETLRMAAPLPNFLPRQATEDHKLGDLDIRAGTIVVVAGVTNNFDPEYHDDPNTFNPERWLDEKSKTRQSTSKNAYISLPFSTGARSCSGREMGIALVRIVFGLFVKKFNYQYTDKNYEMVFTTKLFQEPLETLNYSLTPKN